MTYPYQWASLPSSVDVKCPSCEGHAYFRPVGVVRIELKSDIDYFKESDVFEYQFVTKGFRQSNWHAAIFYHELKRTSPETIADLPDGYSASDWGGPRSCHSKQPGTLVCRDCTKRQKWILNWPMDAFFQTDLRGEVLWAYDRQSLVALKNYISATERDTARESGYKAFLMNVPKHFLTAKIRPLAIKKIDRLLSA